MQLLKPSAYVSLFYLQKSSSTTSKTGSLLLYLDVSSVCGAEVPYCAAVHRSHGDRGHQGVRQLLLPVLQPLDKLGDLQAILALFPFVDSLVWIAIIRGALENEKDGMNKVIARAGYCVYVRDGAKPRCF